MNVWSDIMAFLWTLWAWVLIIVWGGDDPSGQCPNPTTDDCVNVGNFAECLHLVGSGCENIVVLESCPVKFRCGDDNITEPEPQEDPCPAASEACMNEENRAQCLDLVAAGCENLLFLESCPLQFACGDDPCPAASEACMNEENRAECLDLVAAGCENLLVMESCPLQFGCGDNNNDRLKRSRRNLLAASSGDADACVTLSVFGNKKCAGRPIRELTFPTWSQPGSPCCK